MSGDYMRGRREERDAIIGWLRAEAEDDPTSWEHAFAWAASALGNIEWSSTVHGLGVMPIGKAPLALGAQENTEDTP
jgi:hypothetical protein